MALSAATSAMNVADPHEGVHHVGSLGRGVVTLGATFPKTGTAIADITGLQFPVAANGIYRFRFLIPYSASATTVGARFALNGPSLVLLAAKVRVPTAVAATTETNVNAYDTPVASATASPFTTGNLAIIEGIVRPLLAGNVVARLAAETAAGIITVQPGASVEWERIA